MSRQMSWPYGLNAKICLCLRSTEADHVLYPPRERGGVGAPTHETYTFLFVEGGEGYGVVSSR